MTPAQNQTIVHSGATAQVLTHIYDTQTELAVWQRDSDPELERYALSVVNSERPFRGINASLHIDEIASYINEKLPQGQGRQAMINDLLLLCDMFSCLFELDYIGMRLVKLEQTMCPKLHCDKVPCRLLLSYLGAATQYSVLPQSKLAEQSTQPPLDSIPLHAVALLKGQAWDETNQHGLLHRSPVSEEVYPRLMLSLDFAG